MPQRHPHVVVLAGPNGAGKSTAATILLKGALGVTEFVNMDVIAEGLSAFEPERVSLTAGKIMLTRLRELARQRASFAFETTLSGIRYSRLIPHWQVEGYHVKLIFLYLPSVELAIARVRARVAQGGHDIADPIIRSRFERGLINFSKVYRPLVDSWAIYDNSGVSPVLIESGDNP